MFLKEKKSGLLKWVGIFFAAMAAFTLASRAIYQKGTAVVTVAKPSQNMIAHSLRIPGKTQQNQEVAVTTLGGLRVGKVLVSEGQQVEAGQPLFVLDLTYLEEEITRQQQEIRKQKLSVQDAWNQNAQAQKQRANQKAQAEENYDAAISQAQVNLERAERDLDRAEEALENFLQGGDREEALNYELQNAQAQREAAEAALESLQGQIQQAIDQAIAQAEQALQQPAPPEEEGQPPEPQNEGLSQEEKDGIAADIRGQYAGDLAEKEGALAQAQADLAQAQQAWEAFQQNQGQNQGEEELTLAVEQAMERYEDALAALDQAETTYGRAVKSANLPASTSSSAQIGQITLEQMEAQLEKLYRLQENQGQILAPTQGVVTSCAVQTGQKTSDTTAVLLADLSQGCKFVAQATKEQSRYLGVGDRVKLKDGNGKIYEDLTVTSFSPMEGSEDSRLTVQVPAGTLALGASAELQYTRKSQIYNCCVPLSSLHVDEKNQTYVLVAQEVDSVMGRHLAARKVAVTVLERNDTTAALADGALGSGDSVIVGWDRAIAEGSRVRVS